MPSAGETLENRRLAVVAELLSQAMTFLILSRETYVLAAYALGL